MHGAGVHLADRGCEGSEPVLFPMNYYAFPIHN